VLKLFIKLREIKGKSLSIQQSLIPDIFVFFLMEEMKTEDFKERFLKMLEIIFLFSIGVLIPCLVIAYCFWLSGGFKQ
tara:strand:+ start:5294 stop:5527 length:234 start_codon:yes stop_codon:yes gene_type:complete